ncbi:MAG: hypothetical protein ACI85O_001019 [Saprospiraceae bacterium]|jgi:hypothetical protein
MKNSYQKTNIIFSEIVDMFVSLLFLIKAIQMKLITPKGHILIFLIIFLPLFSFSQSDNISTLMQQLSQEVTTVDTKKYTYEQSLTYDEKFPNQATLEAARVDSKGKSKAQTYQFNLSEFDKNSVRKDNVKDVIVVQLNVEKKQKFIGTFSDGERDKYVNELEIIGTDVDNIRAIMDLLKKIIPLAKEIPPAEPLPATFDSRMAWLQKNVTDAEKDGKPISQKITAESQSYRTRLVFESEAEAKKESKVETYKFNLIDLKGKKMKLDIKGKNIFLSVNASEKYIRYEKNGELNNFQDDFKIYVSNIEVGKNIVKVLQALIEESPKEVNEIANKALSEITTASDGKTTYLQKMRGQCLMTFETSGEGKKGKTTTEKSIFNYDDLNAKSVKIKVSKRTILVNVETEKSKKLINNFEDGELQNYSNKISIRGSSIENARLIKKELETKIKDCEGKSDCAMLSEETNALMTFVKDQIKDIEIGSKAYGQLLESTDEKPNQWKFTRTEAKKKETEERAYIFNLADIDPKRIDFEVSKKEVTLVLQTNKKEEVIKSYKNSEPDDYEKSIKIYVADIATVRNLVCALKTAIEKL